MTRHGQREEVESISRKMANLRDKKRRSLAKRGGFYISEEAVVEVTSHGWSSLMGIVLGMFTDWVSGKGQTYRLFYNDEVAWAMSDAWAVNRARDYFYNKYEGVSDLTGASVTNFAGKFGLEGLVRAGLDPVEQYVGSSTINIYSNGEELTFVLWNNTSFTSFCYGVGPSWDRQTLRMGGNMYQQYIWTEPIRRRK